MAATSKLRNTCNPCAEAKVGCPRGKPTCTRCAERGLHCTYSATKRAGRISHSNRQAAAAAAAANNNNAAAAASSSAPGTTGPGAATASMIPDMSSQGTTRQSIDNSLPGASTPPPPSTLNQPSDPLFPLLPTSSSSDFQDFFTSTVFFPQDKPSDGDQSVVSPLDFGCDGFGDNIGSNYTNHTINNNNNNNNYNNSSSRSSINNNNNNNKASSNSGGNTINSNNNNSTNDNSISDSISSYGGLRDFAYDDFISDNNRMGNFQNIMNGMGSYNTNNFANSNIDRRTNLTNDNNGRSGASLFPGSSQVHSRPPSRSLPTPPSRSSVPPYHTALVARLSPENNNASSSTESLMCGQTSYSNSSSRCLMRALSFLPQLSLNNTETCSLTTDDFSPPQRPDFDQVISRNEQTIEAIQTTLQCSCANDGYLLVILSLAVFSILTGYTTILRDAHSVDQNSDASKTPDWQRSSARQKLASLGISTGVEYDGNGEVQQRLTGQLILSKLSGVQQVVNMLSSRLQIIGDKEHGGDGRAPQLKDESNDSRRSLPERDVPLRPFSAKLAHTLEADMRRSLRQVSQAIVEKLRRE